MIPLWLLLQLKLLHFSRSCLNLSLAVPSDLYTSWAAASWEQTTKDWRKEQCLFFFLLPESRNQVRLQKRNGRDTCSLGGEAVILHIVFGVTLFFPARFILIKLSQRLERRAYDWKWVHLSPIAAFVNVGYKWTQAVQKSTVVYIEQLQGVNVSN